MAKKNRRPENGANSGNGSSGDRQDPLNVASDSTAKLPADSVATPFPSGTADPVDSDFDERSSDFGPQMGDSDSSATVAMGTQIVDFDSLIEAGSEWDEGGSSAAGTMRLPNDVTRVLDESSSKKPGSGSGLRDSDYARADVGDFQMRPGSGTGHGSTGRRDKTIRTGGESSFELGQMLPERRVKLPPIGKDERKSRAIDPMDERDDIDYLVTGFLGQGTNGLVYEATQMTLRRPVAIKAFKTPQLVKDESVSQSGAGTGSQRSAKQSGLNPEQLQRNIGQFLYEASITSRLTHPNIIPVFDLGTTEDGDYFYAMKKMEDRPWTPRIRETDNSAKELEANVERFRAVCEAMAYAHQQRIIHRDLKPDNVVLGDFNEVTVVDWGLAVDLKEENYRFEAGGTAPYMAPEMAHHFLATRRRRGLGRLDELFNTEPETWSPDICSEFKVLMTAVAERLKVDLQNLEQSNGTDRANKVYAVVQTAVGFAIDKSSPENRYAELRSFLTREVDKQQRSVLRFAKQISEKSDIYVLGAILFEIAAGHPPHSAPPEVKNGRDRENSSFEMSTKGQIRPVKGKVDPLRRTLGQIAIRAMRYKPEERFESAERLLAALDEFRSQLKSYELAEQGRAKLTQAKAGKGYDHLLVAMEAFREAGQLWNENKEAGIGQDAAAELYAARALNAKDFDAGLSILATYHRGQSDSAAKNGKRLRQDLERGRRNRSRIRTAAVVGWAIALIGLPVMIAVAAERTARIQTAETELGALNSRIQDAEEKAVAADAKLKEADTKIAEADTKIAEADKKIIEADTKVAEANTKIVQAEQRVEEAEAVAKNKVEEAEALVAEADSKVADADKKVADAETKATEAEASANTAIATAAEQSRIAQETLVTARSRIDEAATQVKMAAQSTLDAEVGQFVSAISNWTELLDRNNPISTRDANELVNSKNNPLQGFEAQIRSWQLSHHGHSVNEMDNFKPQTVLPTSESGAIVVLGQEQNEFVAKVLRTVNDEDPQTVKLDTSLSSLGEYRHVALSPDGRLLAFTFNQSSSDPGSTEQKTYPLLIVDLQTGTKHTPRFEETVSPENLTGSKPRADQLASVGFAYFLPDVSAAGTWQLVTVEELTGDQRTSGRLQMVERRINPDGAVLTTQSPVNLDIGSDAGLSKLDYHGAVTSGPRGTRLAVLTEDFGSGYRYVIWDLNNKSPISEGRVQLPAKPGAFGLAAISDGEDHLLCAIDRSVVQILIGESQYKATGLNMREPITHISSTANVADPLLVIDGSGLVSICNYRNHWEITRVVRGLRISDESKIGLVWNPGSPNGLITVDFAGSATRFLQHDLNGATARMSARIRFDNPDQTVSAMARDNMPNSSAVAIGTNRGDLLYYESAQAAAAAQPPERLSAPTPHLARSFRTLDGVVWVKDWGGGQVVFYGQDGSLQLVRAGSTIGVKFPGSEAFTGYQQPRLECAVNGEYLVVVGNHPSDLRKLVQWRFVVEQEQIVLIDQTQQEISFDSVIRRFAISPTGMHMAVIREVPQVESGDTDQNTPVASRDLQLDVANLAADHPRLDGDWIRLRPSYRANDPFVGFTPDGQSLTTNPRFVPDKYDIKPKTVVDTWSLVNSQFVPSEKRELTLKKGESWSVFDWGRIAENQTFVFGLGKGRRFFTTTAIQTNPESPLVNTTSSAVLNRRIVLLHDRQVLLNREGTRLTVTPLSGEQAAAETDFTFKNATDMRRCGSAVLVIDSDGIHLVETMETNRLIVPRQVQCKEIQLSGNHLMATYDNDRTYVFLKSVKGFETKPILEVTSALTHAQLSEDGRWLSHVDASGRLRLWDLNQPAAKPVELDNASVSLWTSNQLLIGRREGTNLKWDLWDSQNGCMLAEEAKPAWLQQLPRALPQEMTITPETRLFAQLSPAKDFLSFLFWQGEDKPSQLFVASCVPGRPDNENWLRELSDSKSPFVLRETFPNPTQVTFSDVGGLEADQHSSRLAVVVGQESRSLRYLAMFVEDITIEPIQVGGVAEENSETAAEHQPERIRRQKIADWSSLIDREINPRHAGFAVDGRTLIQCQESRITILQALSNEPRSE